MLHDTGGWLTGAGMNSCLSPLAEPYFATKAVCKVKSVTTHTWRCTQLHKVHQLSREKGRTPQDWSHHSRALGCLESAEPKPSRDKWNFFDDQIFIWVAEVSCTCWRSPGVRGWQDQTPSHRNRPPFVMGQRISATSALPWHTKKGFSCLSSVTNQYFHTQNVGPWSCLQTTLSKGLPALSLWAGSCTGELGIQREGRHFKQSELKIVQHADITATKHHLPSVRRLDSCWKMSHQEDLMQPAGTGKAACI